MPPKRSRSSSLLPEIMENNDAAVPGNNILAIHMNEMIQGAHAMDGIVNRAEYARMADVDAAAELEHEMPAMDAAGAALYDEIQNVDAVLAEQEALAIKASLLMKDIAAILARAMMPAPAPAEVLPAGEVAHDDDA